MENTDQNGDIEGKTPAQALEVAELSQKVNGEVREVEVVPETTSGAVEKDLPGTQQELDDLLSDEDVSQQEISRTSDLEEEVSDDDKEDYQVNGKVSDEESGQKTEELVSEKQNLEVHEGRQEVGEVIEVVEEYFEETVENTKKPEEEKGVTEREVVEPEAEEIVEKKKIKYVEEDIDDLDFSDGPDSPQEPETEGSVAEFIEEQGPDVIVEESEEDEEEEHTEVEESLQSQQDLVDGEQKTKELVQSVKTEEVIPTKDLRETKESTKEKEKELERNTDRLTVHSVQRRRSSGENFQKLKDRFSNITQEEENNLKNNKEKENERARGASNMSDAKKRFGGTSEKCTQCNRTVYPMEKMEVAGRLLHKTCFKCCKCNSQLSVGRFSIGGKDMYCMTHYKQAFREKGTYDVFTPDNPIKGKWENKAHE